MSYDHTERLRCDSCGATYAPPDTRWCRGRALLRLLAEEAGLVPVVRSLEEALAALERSV